MPGENLRSKALLISALVFTTVILPQTVKAQSPSEVGVGLKQSSTQPALRFPPEPSNQTPYQPSIELPPQAPMRSPGQAMDVTQPNIFCGMGGPAEPVAPDPNTSLSPLPGESISQVPDPLSDLSTTSDAATIGVVTQCSMDAPPAPEAGFPVPLPASP